MKKWYYKLPQEWVETLKSKRIDTQPRPTVTLSHANFRGAASLTLQTILESECIYGLLVYIFCEFFKLDRVVFSQKVHTDTLYVQILYTFCENSLLELRGPLN